MAYDGYRPNPEAADPDVPVICVERSRSVVEIRIDARQTMRLLRTHWSTGIVTEAVEIETVPAPGSQGLLV